MERQQLERAFSARFGEGSVPRLFFAPSRVNLIGEHIDYNGGEVLPCAIDIGTYGMVRPRGDGRVSFASENLPKRGEFSLEALPDYDEDNDWMNYPLGVLRFLRENGWMIGGADILVSGDIPNGAGLSSSASLELLIGETQNRLYNEGKIPALELAKIGKKTENAFIGLNSGIMDQFAIAMGRHDQAMLLNTGTLDYRYVKFDLRGNRLVIINSNKRRELKDSKYNERQAECVEALRLLQVQSEQQGKTPPRALCELTENDGALIEQLPTRQLRRRVRHCVSENARVEQAIVALEAGDIVWLGRLLNESHVSLRDDYEVTGREMDSIAAASWAFDGCLGARMTGGGFGGCAIAIVAEDRVEAYRERVGREYYAATGLRAEFIEPTVSDGVKELF